MKDTCTDHFDTNTCFIFYSLLTVENSGKSCDSDEGRSRPWHWISIVSWFG
jgi:hypothetical protein